MSRFHLITSETISFFMRVAYRGVILSLRMQASFAGSKLPSEPTMKASLKMRESNLLAVFAPKRRSPLPAVLNLLCVESQRLCRFLRLWCCFTYLFVSNK
uniref:Secreted protein n=1 Tax=Panagrellus redivivus TaxID=6233 RepID=A0A7E4VSF0_PANRE